MNDDLIEVHEKISPMDGWNKTYNILKLLEMDFSKKVLRISKELLQHANAHFGTCHPSLCHVYTYNLEAGIKAHWQEYRVSFFVDNDKVELSMSLYADRKGCPKKLEKSWERWILKRNHWNYNDLKGYLPKLLESERKRYEEKKVVELNRRIYGS